MSDSSEKPALDSFDTITVEINESTVYTATAYDIDQSKIQKTVSETVIDNILPSEENEQ